MKKAVVLILILLVSLLTTSCGFPFGNSSTETEIQDEPAPTEPNFIINFPELLKTDPTTTTTTTQVVVPPEEDSEEGGEEDPSDEGPNIEEEDTDMGKLLKYESVAFYLDPSVGVNKKKDRVVLALESGVIITIREIKDEDPEVFSEAGVEKIIEDLMSEFEDRFDVATKSQGLNETVNEFVARVSYFQMIGRAGNPNSVYKSVVYIVSNIDAGIYTIVFEAEEQDYHEYLEEFLAILESIHLIEEAP